MKRRVSPKATDGLMYSFAPVVAVLSLLTILFSPTTGEFFPEFSSKKEKNYHQDGASFLMMPQPDISGKRFACPNSTTQYQTPNMQGNTYTWSLNAGGTITAQNGNVCTVAWTGPQGGGPYILRVEEMDPNGGTATDTFHVYIQNINMACNDTIQLSLDEFGNAVVQPDQILEGTYIDFSGFTVSISGGFGQNLGNSLNCSHIGRYFKVTVTGECDQNSCWSTIFVEDKLPPVLNCPVDTVVLECYENPDNVPYPVATDNCGANPIVNLISQETDTNDPCPGKLLKRTFEAADQYGNRSGQCVQYIRILPPAAPTFPDDISWTCEQYAAFPNIIDPTRLHTCILNNAAEMDKSRLYCIYDHGDDIPGVDPYDSTIDYWTDNEDLDVTLDPYYDDDVDNPLTDPSPNQLDPVSGQPIFTTYANPSAETDDRPDICNLTLGLCPYRDTVTDNRHHYPVDIIFPIHRNAPQIRGLEDADVLAATGSGVPAVMGSACPLSITYHDQKLEACDGVDTNVVFKILRNWTILNWCTGEIYTDLQVIKVLDKIAPAVFVDTFSVKVDPQPNPIPHQECRSTGFLNAPVITDNCQTGWTVQIYTPVGEAIYTNGVDGKNGGRIPQPGLPEGTHTIKYVATDACGNRTEYFVDLRVIDDAVPVMICREITDVSLTIDGTGRVKADKFDEASYDNCCLDSFVVKRMNEPDSLFDSHIVFNCSEIGDTVMIILRAYDCSGNYNQCMVEVHVKDKLRPVCQAPADIWTTCTETHHLRFTDTTVLQSYFGKATVTDNCGAWVKELTPDVDVDVCGIGTIVRRFIATDSSGNQSLGLCRQTIHIKAVFDYKINFPADWMGKCGDMENAPKLTFTQNECDRLAYTYEDLRFDISSDGACYKIIRTWTIMNWCAYDGHSQPVLVPHHPNGIMVTDSTYNAFGYYQYQQIIKVVDDVPPVITYNGPTEFCGGYTQQCTGDVDILPDIQEECTSDLDVKWKLDLYNDGTNDINGINRFKRSLPFGRHKLIYDVRDGCGNRAQKEIIFTVKDCKKPTPICINGLSVDLMQNGTVSLWATDFEQGSSSDNCTPRNALRFRINRIVDVNGDRQITAADYQMNVPATDTVMFRCRDFGINYVQMWVGDVFDNWDFCVTFIDVQDNMFMCRTGSKIIGNISTEKNKGVGGVKVDLSGNRPLSAMTTDDGMFDFPNVAKDYDYTVAPYKDEDPTNGVTTFDLTLISKHILGVQKLDSPYKIIAADANKSGSVTTFDMVELRKLILRVIPNLRSNTSWRFVRKDFRFTDPTNPFAQPFPEVLSINNFSNDKLDADFVAIKIGDINGNAKTTNNLSGDLDDRSFEETLTFKTQNKTLIPGEEITLDFEPSKDENLLGFQFTFQFDPQLLEFVDLGENEWFGLENFGLAFLNEGIITASWDNAARKSLEGGELKFAMTFRAKAPVQLSDVLKINSNYTAAEAYKFDGEMMHVALDFGDGTQADGFDLYQNKPNPFADGTVIGFQLPESGNASVTVFDVSGKVVKKFAGNWQSGYHEISIHRSELPASGIFYYRLEAAKNTATKKMILID